MKCSLLLVLLLSVSIIFAQDVGKIIVSNAGGNPLSFAHVTYASLEGKNGATILTDKDGGVLIPKSFTDKNSRFIVSVNYLGFEGFVDTLNASENKTVYLKESPVSLNNVVITGQYSEGNPEKSIHKVKIIDRKQMDDRGVVTLDDALQFETNMRLSQDNVLGSSISVQGMSGENVKIMIDGVPIIGRQDGNIDLNQINLNNVERIEIVEGPLSVNYGSNALAGTINIITKKTASNQYNLSANTYYESVGQYNLDGGLTYFKGNNTLLVNAGRNFFDGWSPNESYSFFPQSKPADTNRNLQWNPKEQVFANTQYTLSRKNTKYRVFADYFKETITDRGVPRGPYYLLAFDEYFQTRRYSLGIDLNGNASKTLKWSALAAYNDYQRSRNTFVKDLTTLEENLTLNPNDHDTTSIQSAMSRGSLRLIRDSSKANWELGYDFNQETARGKRIDDGKQSIGDYAFFTTAELYLISDLTIKPGLRYAYNTKYNAPLIPSVNVKYNFNTYTFRASFAKGFRAPSLKELYFDFVDINHNIVGNDALKAETSSNFQFDVTKTFSKNQKRLKLEAGLFYNNLKDMIALAQVGSTVTYTYFNIGKYRTQGIDISASTSVNHWKFTIGTVYTGRSALQVNTDDDLKIRYNPELRSALTYEFKKLLGNLSLFYKYNGKVPVFTVDELGETSERFQDDYQMIDLAFTKYLNKKRLRWTIGVKNLLDVQNLNSSASAGGAHNGGSSTVPVAWGRSIFTSIKYTIGWK